VARGNTCAPGRQSVKEGNGNLLEFRSIALDLSSLRMFETDPNQSAVLQRLGVEMMYMNVYECILYDMYCIIIYIYTYYIYS
jgi:hypothetical protein